MKPAQGSGRSTGLELMSVKDTLEHTVGRSWPGPGVTARGDGPGVTGLG